MKIRTASQTKDKNAGRPPKVVGIEQPPRARKASIALPEPAPLSGTEQMSRVWQRFYVAVSESLEK